MVGEIMGHPAGESNEFSMAAFRCVGLDEFYGLFRYVGLVEDQLNMPSRIVFGRLDLAQGGDTIGEIGATCRRDSFVVAAQRVNETGGDELRPLQLIGRRDLHAAQTDSGIHLAIHLPEILLLGDRQFARAMIFEFKCAVQHHREYVCHRKIRHKPVGGI